MLTEVREAIAIYQAIRGRVTTASIGTGGDFDAYQLAAVMADEDRQSDSEEGYCHPRVQWIAAKIDAGTCYFRFLHYSASHSTYEKFKTIKWTVRTKAKLWRHSPNRRSDKRKPR